MIPETNYLKWYAETRCKHQDDKGRCNQEREIIVESVI